VSQAGCVGYTTSISSKREKKRFNYAIRAIKIPNLIAAADKTIKLRGKLIHTMSSFVIIFICQIKKSFPERMERISTFQI